MTFPLPVILRSGSDEGSFSVGPVGDGRRSFAVLRMTMGKALRMTMGRAPGMMGAGALGMTGAGAQDDKKGAVAAFATAPFIDRVKWCAEARGVEDAKLSRAWPRRGWHRPP